MPDAYRVYCDYDNFNPNFYLYFGNYADKKVAVKDTDTQQGIFSICANLGLEPVDLKNEG